MRKVFLGLCISLLVTAMPVVKNEGRQSFFVSLMDMAYPYGQAEAWSDEEKVSAELLESWVDAALPWEAAVWSGTGDDGDDPEMDPVIQVIEQKEYFTGIPEDHFVTIQQIAEIKDIAELRSYYNQDLIKNYDKTISLYNYDSDSMKPSREFIDGKAFMAADLRLEEEVLRQSEEPVVLIFHTHAHEGYVDKEEFGILDVGEHLEHVLENQYGIQVLHHKAVYDEGGVNGAYTRMGADIEQVLAENPSIQVMIDMHRDGVAEDTRLVTKVNEKDTAQIMLVTGVSRTFDENGDLQVIDYLPNENLNSVLALGFQMKMASDVLYPDFMRPLYLSCWRYSTYMMPRSMLLEVGAQTNTLEEAKAAMEPFAELLVGILQERK